MTVMALLSFAAVSCNQDNVFEIIASETAPQKPRIEGAPTNMAVFQREYTDPDDENNKITVPIMCVASGRLHWYKVEGDDKREWWDSSKYNIPQPGGRIISLAVAGNRLYALCHDKSNDVNATLRYIESDGEEWETISSEASSYPVIQSIYVDPQSTRLFAGAAGKNKNQVVTTYAVLYLGNDGKTLKLLKDNTSIFSGAAYHETEKNHYLSTRGNGKIGGIFRVSEADLAADKTDGVKHLTDGIYRNRMFISMIKLKDTHTIIAVERSGGALYEVHSNSFVRMRDAGGRQINIGKYATEALTLWEDKSRNLKLLVIGIQGELYSTTSSSHTYGYVEFELNPNDTVFTRHDPPRWIAANQNQYTASLSKHPVNHLFQAPKDIDPDMTFFASTQTAGLWSYRNRPDKGGWQWNAEE